MLKRNCKKTIFDYINIIFLCIIMIIMIYPLYFTIIASFSEPTDVATGKVLLWIKGFTLDSYKEVFKDNMIWIGYRNSIIYTVLYTFLSLAVTIPCAYVLSKKWLVGRKIISFYFIFTMWFSGGLIPYYLLVKKLTLTNKPYTLIVLGFFSVYNMIVSRVYYDSSISPTIYEAAEIDGCSQIQQFFKIALPLSKPIIAVIALYYSVGKWNDFFSGLMYISNKNYYPLQLVLRNILLQNQSKLSMIDTSVMKDEQVMALIRQAYLAEGMKYALIFIASIPMLIIYPFVQKFFVKGIMVGSLKG